jgi:hypothetical protein
MELRYTQAHKSVKIIVKIAHLEFAAEAFCLQGLVCHDYLLDCCIVELEPPVLVGVDGCMAFPFLIRLFHFVSFERNCSASST